MMRSSRVREETPQPTMRVTDGSSALSMIYREETRPNMPLRADYKHAHIHIPAEGKPALRATDICRHRRSLWVCAIWNSRQLPVGKWLNGTIRPRLRQGDPKVNMSERWSGKLNKWSGSLRFSIELLSQQMRRGGYCTYISLN